MRSGALDSPASRRQRIAQIRREIQQGTYESDDKLRIAIQRLLDHLRRYPGSSDEDR